MGEAGIEADRVEEHRMEESKRNQNITRAGISEEAEFITIWYDLLWPQLLKSVTRE